MKIEEVRRAIKEWPEEDKIKLLSMMYRKLPKTAKDEIDCYVENGMGDGGAKPKKPEKPKQDISKLEEEIEAFVSNAREGNYYYANRSISKKERSNWRNTVKAFLRELREYDEGTEEYNKATLLLCDLYDILGRGTTIYTFATTDTFHTAGFEDQEAFYAELCERVKVGGYQEDVLDKVIYVGCNGSVDYMTSSNMMPRVFAASLSTKQRKKHALEIVKKQFEPIKTKYNAFYRKASFMLTEEKLLARGRFETTGKFVVRLYTSLGMLDDAYNFAMNEKFDFESEVTLYKLLMYYDLSDQDWITIYEKGIENGIKPRDNLVTGYEEKKASMAN